MTNVNEELQRSTWQGALESLSKEHQGDVVTIEVTTLDFGDQFEAEQLPLAYIEYDPHDDAASVGVGGRDGRFPVVLRHVIEHPASIVVDTEATEGATALQIADPDGTTTIITLHPRPELPA
ncbi:MAG TPA: DUF5335 family protein [Acidimicrobiales bacterium]|jgi:hypothetical protein